LAAIAPLALVGVWADSRASPIADSAPAKEEKHTSSMLESSFSKKMSTKSRFGGERKECSCVRRLRLSLLGETAENARVLLSFFFFYFFFFLGGGEEKKEWRTLSKKRRKKEKEKKDNTKGEQKE
jgi:hypothetical protein